MTSRSTTFTATLAVLAAAMLWGTTGTLQSILPEAREPLVVGALRLWIGATSLILLASLQPAAHAAFGQIPKAPLLLASAAIAAYNLLFFAAVARAGVGLGTAVTIGSAPLWVAAYDIAVLRCRPSPRKAFGQAIAIAGAALLVLSGSSSGVTPFGLLLAAAAGLSYATYSLASSRMAQHAPPAAIAAGTFTLAALFTTPVFLLVPWQWAFAGTAPLTLLALGLGSTGLAYALYTWGLKALPASTAVTLALAEPLTAWVLALIVVGETATPLKLAGAALLLAGLYIVTSDKRAEGL
jgi:drug/metabolite transporter, DME family